MNGAVLLSFHTLTWPREREGHLYLSYSVLRRLSASDLYGVVEQHV